MGHDVLPRLTRDGGAAIAPLDIAESRAQAPLPDGPFDTWSGPGGAASAEFHRWPAGFLVRFPGQVDFVIDTASLTTSAHPVPGCEEAAQTLFENAVVPLLGNHCGVLHLHASAVVLPQGVIAFLGRSRSGKTTLAGAFARRGYPYLTEDVLELRRSDSGYSVIPKPLPLRLFADSANRLLGTEHGGGADAGSRKAPLAATDKLPFAAEPAPLRHVFLLQPPPGSAAITLRPTDPVRALAALAQQSFVLDVDDRTRLAEHFSRLAVLADAIPCTELDYPRDYNQLEAVVSAIIAHCG